MKGRLSFTLRSAMNWGFNQFGGVSRVPSFSSMGRRVRDIDARAAALPAALVVAVLLLILFGQDLLGLDREGVSRFLTAVQTSPWAPLAVVIVFVAMALVGFPQAILFAVTVAVFGAWEGAVLSWVATTTSGAVTFSLGRIFGAGWVRKVSKGRAEALIGIMQRRGLLASMIVRWVPSAPFIVVNSLCGASGMAYWKFAVGTGIGIVPKLALIAFFTEQLDDLGRFLTSGDPSAFMALAGILAAWGAFFLFCRWLYGRLRSTSLAGLAGDNEISEASSKLGRDQDSVINLKSNAR